MPIDTTCNGCGNRLRVAEQHAGKKARCPKCGNVYIVPNLAADEASGGEQPAAIAEQSATVAAHNDVDSSHHSSAGATPAPMAAPTQTAADSNSGAATPQTEPRNSSNHPAVFPHGSSTTNDRPAAPGEASWMFRSENGHIYGPVTRQQLSEWAAEGRVSADCQLQLVGGDGRWESVTGWLDRRQMSGAGAHPSTQVNVGQTYDSVTSYDAAMSNPSSIGRARPHRGVLVIILGVLGIGCPIFSAMAWAIAYRDLAEMDAGRMDPGGRTLTSAGMVMGIIMITIQSLIFLAFIADA